MQDKKDPTNSPAPTGFSSVDEEINSFFGETPQAVEATDVDSEIDNFLNPKAPEVAQPEPEEEFNLDNYLPDMSWVKGGYDYVADKLPDFASEEENEANWQHARESLRGMAFGGSRPDDGKQMGRVLGGVPASAAANLHQWWEKRKLWKMMTELEQIRSMNPEYLRPQDQERLLELGTQVTEQELKIKELQAIGESIPAEDIGPNERLVREGLVQFTSLLPATLGTVLTRDPSIVTFFGGDLAKQAAYAEAIDKGKSHEEAELSGLASQVIEMGTEMAPAHFLAKAMGPAYESGKVGAEALKFAVTDIGGEQLATFMEDMKDWAMGLNEEMEKAETTEEKVKLQMERQYGTLVMSLVGAGMNVAALKGYEGARRQADKGLEELKKKFQKEGDKAEFVGPLYPQELEGARKEAVKAERTVEEAKQKLNEIAEETVDPDQTFESETSLTSQEKRGGKPAEDTYFPYNVDLQSTKPYELFTQEGQKVSLMEEVESPNRIPKTLIRINEGANSRTVDQLKTISEQVERWRAVYLPNHTLLVGEPLGNGGQLGNSMNSEAMSHIGIMPGLNPKMTLSVLAHEFGHSVVAAEFRKLPKVVQDALRTEHSKLVGDVIDQGGTVSDLGRVKRGPVMRGYDFNPVPLSDLPQDKKTYHLGFEEYLADQATLLMGKRGSKMGKLLTEFYRRVKASLLKFWKSEGYKAAPGKTFEQWYDTLALSTDAMVANQQLEEKTQAYTETRKQVMQEQEAKGPTEFDPMLIPEYQAMQHDAWIADIDNVSMKKLEELATALRKGELNLNKQVSDDLTGKMDKFGSFRKNMLTLLQIAKDNPHIGGLAHATRWGSPSYIQIQRFLETDRTIREQKVEALVKDWKKLGSKQAEKVGRFMQELDYLSFREKAPISTERMQQIGKQIGITEEGFKVYQQVREYLREAIGDLHTALLERAKRTMDQDSQEYAQYVAQLNDEFGILKNRNFFPSQRFGRFAVVVVANEGTEFQGQKVRKGSTIIREHFEKEAHAKERADELRRMSVGKGNTVYTTKVAEDQIYSFNDMPSAVMDVLKDFVPQEQWEALKAAVTRSSVGSGFAKHLVKKRGVAGASRDYMRSLLSYSSSLAHHLGQINYRDQMNQAIEEVSQGVNDINMEGGDSTKRQMIKEWMAEHRDYVFNPGNEFHQLSSLAFFWYLAYLPKQAMLNLTQVPMVAFPYLMHKYGPRAMADLNVAIKDVMVHKLAPNRITPDLKAAIEYAIGENLLDQSFSHELAGLQQAQTLRNLVPIRGFGDRLGKAVAQANALGAVAFHGAEIFGRRIVFVAAYRAEMAKHGDTVRAYRAAREAVQATMFEYARWNRPRMMRGKMRPFTVFMTFMQHYLYLLMGSEPAKWLVLAMLIANAGIMGIPFMQDAAEVITWLIRKYQKESGDYSIPADAKYLMREGVGKMVEQVNGEPDAVVTDAILHGAGRYGWGLGALGRRMDMPVPDVDLSGSLGLGRIIPGISAINAPDLNAAVAEGTEGILGPALGIPMQLVRAMHDEHGSALEKAAAYGPQFMKYPLKSWQWYKEGAAETKSGTRIAEFDPSDPLHGAELMAHAMGFPLTRVRRRQDAYGLEYELVMYYRTSRGLVLRNLYEAAMTQDPQVLKDAREALQRYNNSVPVPALRITAAEAKASLKGRATSDAMKDRYLPTNKRDIPLVKEIREAFPPEDTETIEVTEEVISRRREGKE